VKSYLRKAKALHILLKFHKAIEVVETALTFEPENEDFI